MFDINIVDSGDDLFAVQLNGKTIAVCDEQRANFWRCIGHPDKVFVSGDVAISFSEEPELLCKFRISVDEMWSFLNEVFFTYDHVDNEMHVGWVEIDPSITRMFKQKAESIVSSCSMWLDEDDNYPKDVPFILIHPDRNTVTGEAYVEMMFIKLEEYSRVEEEEHTDL